MTEYYRAHRIQLICTGAWDAIIVEAASGTVMPTKATARLQEGRAVAIARACDLIDIYIDGAPAERRHAA